jgi:hypothetical protein
MIIGTISQQSQGVYFNLKIVSVTKLRPKDTRLSWTTLDKMLTNKQWIEFMHYKNYANYLQKKS